MHYCKLMLSTALALTSVWASADEVTTPPELTGVFSVVSEYLVSGVAQSGHRPAVQGGINYDHPSGFYLANWNSTVSWVTENANLDLNGDGQPDGGANNSIEMDFLGGYRLPVGPVTLDLGVQRYYYPGRYSSEFVSPNTVENYLIVSYQWASLRMARSTGNDFGLIAPDGQGTKNTKFLDFSANPPLTSSLILNLHAGYTKVTNFDTASYADWKIGLTQNLPGHWAVSIAGTGTNAHKDVYVDSRGKNLAAPRLSLGVSKYF